MALAFHKHIDAQTSFAVWKIEETAGRLYSQLQLKDHERDYLDTLNNGKRNLHWLSTRVLLRKMLNTTDYIDARADEHGKLHLTDLPYAISLSHSFDYAAVMISSDKKVGIDIELVKTKIERVAGKFMDSSELGFIDPQHSIDHLYACWCAKEAIYKLNGKKNVSFLQHIKISPFSVANTGLIRAQLILDNEIVPYTVFYERFNDYMIGYVAK